MKNRYLAWGMIFLLAGTLAAGLSCGCVSGDCHGASSIKQSGAPKCHHDSTETRAKDSSRKECCGKCQIEKAAVLFGKNLSLGALPSENVAARTLGSAEVLEAGDRLPAHWEGYSPPDTFFTQHILNFTFSFRAPPQS